MTLTDHPMTAEQVNLLIREGEGLTVEFKEHYTPRIDEDIVAFANAKGGTIYSPNSMRPLASFKNT
jgi:hypothetical protein